MLYDSITPLPNTFVYLWQPRATALPRYYYVGRRIVFTSRFDFDVGFNNQERYVLS